MNDYTIEGQTMGIRMVCWAPFEKAMNYAGMAVMGFRGAVLEASWQWRISDKMKELIHIYRLRLEDEWYAKRYSESYMKYAILRQRRLDRRYHIPSSFYDKVFAMA